MTKETYSLPSFIDDLRAIAAQWDDDREIIPRARPLVQRLTKDGDWLEPRHYICDEEQGFGVHLLHEEADHSLAMFAVAWLPGRGVGPHNHGTWAVVAGVDGDERNVNWSRLDDGARPGHAEIVAAHEVVVGRSDVITFLPDDIHSVHNDGDRVTVSLHVYGRHPNHTLRQQFDPEAKTATDFKFKTA